MFALLARTGLWLHLARPLPLAMVALLVWSVRRLRASGDGEPRARALAALLLSVFALVLMIKIALNVNLGHYGFALAMPAALLTTAAALSWAPAAVERRGGNGRLFLGLAAAAWIGVVLPHVLSSNESFRTKRHAVGRGADRLLADDRGPVVAAAVDEIAQRVRPDQTLLVLPEGVMLNYLARRRNSTPYLNFMPPEVLIFGEDRMLAGLRAAPPDFVALVDRDTTEYGVGRFGRDYAVPIFEWVRAEYEEVRLVGRPPLVEQGFGILLLRRR